MDVPGAVEKLLEPFGPRVAGNGFRARALDELHRGTAPQVDRRRGNTVDDQLPPAYAERTSPDVLHETESASRITASSGGGRRMNEASTRSSSAASGASVASARTTSESAACHSMPCVSRNGRTQTTCPFA